jgi:hypothetical protein
MRKFRVEYKAKFVYVKMNKWQFDGNKTKKTKKILMLYFRI